MLVSAIMPTFGRRELIGVGIRSFLSQDWPEKELIILDNGNDGTEAVVPQHPEIRYERLEGPRLRVGAMRNACIERARGDLIVHFDSDDWSAPQRITDQVERLMASGRSVSGYWTMLFWNEARQQASRYRNGPNYSLGSALCFRRAFWEQNRFQDSSVAEDLMFAMAAHERDELISVEGYQTMVARIHNANTSNRTGPLKWPEVAIAEIPAEFFADLRG